MIDHITWMGHATFRIDAEKVIYIDPWKLKGDEPKADIILITHDHYDHCEPKDVAKIQKDDTVIVTTADCARKLSGDIRIVTPGQRVELDGVIVEAVAAYNLGKEFHPQANGWVGYVLTAGGQRIYHTGDSDLTEAAQAANAIGPRWAVPMHYGDIVGSDEDAARFEKLCRVPVKRLQPNRS
jgi:L-ascorbate metabolism protein UlaG (beta-lactamase superfamily)